MRRVQSKAIAFPYNLFGGRSNGSRSARGERGEIMAFRKWVVICLLQLSSFLASLFSRYTPPASTLDQSSSPSASFITLPGPDEPCPNCQWTRVECCKFVSRICDMSGIHRRVWLFCCCGHIGCNVWKSVCYLAIPMSPESIPNRTLFQPSPLSTASLLPPSVKGAEI